MRIGHIVSTRANSIYPKKQTKVSSVPPSNRLDTGIDSVSFKAKLSLEEIKKIEWIEDFLLNNFGMTCKFNYSDVVAMGVFLTTSSIIQAFGEKFLPDVVCFGSFEKNFPSENFEGTLGIHFADPDSKTNFIFFNKDEVIFDNFNTLGNCTRNMNFFNQSSSRNNLFTFVHEFAHSVHYKYLLEKGKEEILHNFRQTKLPNSFAEFIATFKLSNYSATNLNEFMAERIAQDICNNLNWRYEFTGKKEDFDYSDIFTRKWSSKYSSAQAYLDYFTQQIWNGDVEKSKNALGMMETYLKEYKETQKANTIFSKIAQKYEEIGKSKIILGGEYVNPTKKQPLPK